MHLGTVPGAQLQEWAIDDLKRALEACPGDAAIVLALQDAVEGKAVKRRGEYREAREKAGCGGGGGGGGKKSVLPKGFSEWDNIDYDKECEKLDEESLKEGGWTDEDIYNKKILDVVKV